MKQNPTVSIVTATYNRSDVLAMAIESVLGQSVTDWEMLVVGDACTDDTADVVASFGDERVRFINRPENHGEQSAPTNSGAAMARGRFLAYLNHDDLWYPDHLEVGLDCLNRTEAALVYSLRVTLCAGGALRVDGPRAIRGGRLHDGIPASTWVSRRELVESLGPWRSAFELRLAPSQDWMVRALDRGARVACTGELTVVMVPSAQRKGAYLATDPADMAAARDLLGEARRRALARMPNRWRDRLDRDGWRRFVTHGVFGLVAPIIASAGYHPYVAKANLRNYGPPGDFMRVLRARRGLPREPKPEAHG